jgi:NAD(P)-dependent dehydrogenase (short-subunit alcohol dehydrogenase family)
MSEQEFSNKVVFVSGASGGIGAGIVRGFAEHGARVILHYHQNKENAQKVADEIQKAGGDSDIIQADLTNPNQVETCFQQIQQKFGKLDVAINNAGVYLSNALITEMDPGEWHKMMDADLNSAFLCIQAEGKLMSTQTGGGVIINISSVESMFPVKGHSYYNVSKAGMNMLTRSAAQELGKAKVRVNTISPGLIWKEGIEESWPDGVKSWISNAPLQSLGMPDDIANACLFFASDKARWITGTNLVVDGGFSCRAIL